MMGKNTAIEWAHHTANLWWGCVKVHEGCDHCYAEKFDKRVGGSHWGTDAPRRAIASVWQELAKWQKQAAEENTFYRVFVGSMMDIFERSCPTVDHKGNLLDVTTGELRDRLFNDVVPNSPNLLFMFLTKRAGNITKMVPAEWLDNPPANVMYGVSVVNQETADRDIPKLLAVSGRRFLSMEPLLGPVDLGLTGTVPNYISRQYRMVYEMLEFITTGGESGPGARPMHPDWPRDIRDQCEAAGVPFHFKQWGAWRPVDGPRVGAMLGQGCADGSAWPENAKRIYIDRDGHEILPDSDRSGIRRSAWTNYIVARIGKRKAGRILDGRTHDNLPTLEIPHETS